MGFDYSPPLQSAHRYIMQSALLHPAVINKNIQGEQANGWILGSFTTGALPGLHMNRMGMIRKATPLGAGTDLSFLEGLSVNDPSLC